MQEDKKKTKWVKPKLIVLIKGRPEERVLDGCKVVIGIFGAGGYYGGCWPSNCPDRCYAFSATS